jgi:hypothetical protein
MDCNRREQTRAPRVNPSAASKPERREQTRAPRVKPSERLELSSPSGPANRWTGELLAHENCNGMFRNDTVATG